MNQYEQFRNEAYIYDKTPVELSYIRIQMKEELKRKGITLQNIKDNYIPTEEIIKKYIDEVIKNETNNGTKKETTTTKIQ